MSQCVHSQESCKICGFHDLCSERAQLGQTAALHCRVSTADQTCARQERDLRAFAKKAGYKIVGVWKETASGAQRIKADRFAPKVLKLVSEGQSYREISHRLGLSKNTVLEIVKRDRAA
ncbi:MAG TPA: recombinase family protein [Steroidobacteraceae bacterium]|nr:recombinase family protein [Steroidobacteraceae bacterium]